MKTSTSSRCGRSAAGLCLFLLLALPAGPAWAQSFKERYDKAVATFKMGQYGKAIEEFQALYEIKPVPIILFNLAQAHRKAGHLAQALDLYERYLREDPKTELRPEAEGYIKEVEAGLLAERVARKQAEREAARRALEAAITKGLAEEPPPVGYDRSGRRLSGAARPLRILKWAAGAAGLAALGVGAGLLAIHGRPLQSDECGDKLCPQQYDTLIGGATAVAVGGALLVGSAVMFGLDYKRSREGREAAMLTVSGRF
jgi:tetratricopeptide (TPR) repeat protein